ncbi:hypothetical protein RFI_29556, partial [Reticulomyxa filosa]
NCFSFKFFHFCYCLIALVQIYFLLEEYKTTTTITTATRELKKLEEKGNRKIGAMTKKQKGQKTILKNFRLNYNFPKKNKNKFLVNFSTNFCYPLPLRNLVFIKKLVQHIYCETFFKI